MSQFGYEGGGGGDGPKPGQRVERDPDRPLEAQGLAALISDIEVPGHGKILLGARVYCVYRVETWSPEHYLLETIQIVLPALPAVGGWVAKTVYDTIVKRVGAWWTARQLKKTDAKERRLESPKAMILDQHGGTMPEFRLAPVAPSFLEKIRRWLGRSRF